MYQPIHSFKSWRWGKSFEITNPAMDQISQRKLLKLMRVFCCNLNKKNRWKKCRLIYTNEPV